MTRPALQFYGLTVDRYVHKGLNVGRKNAPGQRIRIFAGIVGIFENKSFGHNVHKGLSARNRARKSYSVRRCEGVREVYFVHFGFPFRKME